MLGRSPSTISRELRRNRSLTGGYVAHVAQGDTRERGIVCRPARKLVMGNERFELVVHLLWERFSPEQIAGKLLFMKMDFEDAYVCRETIHKGRIESTGAGSVLSQVGLAYDFSSILRPPHIHMTFKKKEVRKEALKVPEVVARKIMNP